MKQIIKVGILSVAKIYALIYAVIGLVIGAIYGLIFGIVLPAPMNWIAGIGFLLGLPVLFGIMGFVCGLICAALYNWLASKIGGIEIELKDK